jgi:SPX domain protein involved in polyphosphate accumulation
MESDKLKRKEIKFVINLENYNQLIIWIKKNPKGFIKQHNSRLINNIYFDTLNYHFLNENLTGLQKRFKLRLRWYGDLKFINKAYLEIKIKNSQNGWKKKKQITINKQTDTISKKNLNVIITKCLDRKQKNLLDYLSPVLINHYYRDYYVSFDGKIRITIDKNFKVFDQLKYLKINNSIKNYYFQNIVLEIKYDSNLDENLDKLFGSIPFRSSRNSKYVSSFYSRT